MPKRVSLIESMDSNTKKKYIQFSKIITMIFTIVFAVMCFVSIWLCYEAASTGDLVNVVKAFGNFATIGFASYSVNSLGEKIVSKLASSDDDDDEEKDDKEIESDGDNG